MSSSPALESTLWPPTPVKPEVKELISRFFQLVDLNDETAGRKIAEEVFTPEGRFSGPNGAFKGKEGS